MEEMKLKLDQLSLHGLDYFNEV